MFILVSKKVSVVNIIVRLTCLSDTLTVVNILIDKILKVQRSIRQNSESSGPDF